MTAIIAELIFARALSLAAAVGFCFASLPASADEPAVSPVKGQQAITVLAGFDRAWREVPISVGSSSIPKILKVWASCEYGGFWCDAFGVSCNTHKVSKFYDFDQGWGSIENRIDELHLAAAKYREPALSLRGWSTSELPEIQRQFDAAFQRIGNILQENVDDKLTPLHHERLKHEISSLKNELGPRIKKLTDKVKEFDAIDKYVEAQRLLLERDVQDYKSDVEAKLDEAEKEINGLPCGKSDYPAQVKNRRDTFAAHLGSLTQQSSQYGSVIATMHNSVAVLYGTIANIESQYLALIKDLNLFFEDDSSFERERRLLNLEAAYKDLIADAGKELKEGSDLPLYVPGCVRSRRGSLLCLPTGEEKM